MIPDFSPSETWLDDRPFGEDTEVGVLAELTGPGTAPALSAFLDSLIRNEEIDGPVPTFFLGGYRVEVLEQRPGAARLRLSSAGQDGTDSTLTAAEDLAETIRATGSSDVSVTWTELPGRRVGRGPVD